MDLIDEFRTDLKIKGVSAYTITEYPMFIQHFSNWFGGDLLAVDENDIKRYLLYLRERNARRPDGKTDSSGRKLSKATIKKNMTSLSVFYDSLVWSGKIVRNPVIRVRKQYMRDYKAHDASQRRQCLTIPQAKMLVESVLDPREQALILLLLKTGLRRHEMSELDVNGIDLPNLTIRVKPTPKRTGEIVYFDQEAANVLQKWLKIRERENKNNNPALFLDRFGNRLSPAAIRAIVVKHATTLGLHNSHSNRLEDKLTPHALRWFYTTRLREAGCPQEIVQILRGDVGKDAIDTYINFDQATIKQNYLNYIPRLGI